jgi:hypothetical protein
VSERGLGACVLHIAPGEVQPHLHLRQQQQQNKMKGVLQSMCLGQLQR